MDSLLECLNEKIWDAMEAEKEKYPNGHQKLVRDMQDAWVVTDLSVSTASTLIGYGEQVGMNFESNSFVLKLYQIFGK